MIIKTIETEDEIIRKANVHCQAWKEAYKGIVDQSYLDARTLEKSLQSAHWAVNHGIQSRIAVDNGTVAGFVDWGPYRDESLPDAMEIYAIYLLRAYYGKGIGSALMREALANIPEGKQIVLWVLKANHRAIHFYTKCGFQFDGTEKVITLGTDVTEVRMIFNTFNNSPIPDNR